MLDRETNDSAHPEMGDADESLTRKIPIIKKCSFENEGNGEDLLAKIVDLQDR